MAERVGLFATCMAEGLWRDAVAATVRVLAHVGYEAVPVAGQTCCGQPAFNYGDHASAQPILERARALFADVPDVVVPSASCAAMFRHGAQLMGLPPSATKWWELGEFLWERCEVRSWPAARTPERLAFHPACHRRMLGGVDWHERLLALVQGIETVEVPEAEQCCGFGGSFCAAHPSISRGIAEAKLDAVARTGATRLVSTDVGCLAHLEGVDRARGGDMRFSHFAEVIAECL